MIPAWRIVILSPPGYRHSAAFVEVAEALHEAIATLGYPVSCGFNHFAPGACHILLGANLAAPGFAATVPAGTIVYNLEQISEDSPWWHGGLKALVERCEVWDYSARNVETLKRLAAVDRIYHVPLGHVAGWARIPVLPPAARDIDVLFYGSINPRRQAVLDALRQSGLRVVSLFGVYGAARDAAIARARVVLSLHLYPAKILEVVRLGYLLANRKAVVAECSEGTEIYPGMEAAVRLVPYDGLVDACRQLLNDDDGREALAESGKQWFSAQPFSAFLAPHLRRSADFFASAPLSRQAVPGTLSFVPPATGASALFIAHDHPSADIDWPVHESLPLGATFVTQRYGTVHLKDNAFSVIELGELPLRADSLAGLLRDCASLLLPGGRLSLNVPHDLGSDAWSDPAARRAFNEKSFTVFALAHVDFGWPGFSLELVGLELKLSALGARLQGSGIDQESLLNTPRAVARMTVLLEKKTWGALPEPR